MKLVHPRDERLSHGSYRWQVMVSDHPIIEDDDGVLRYKTNPLVQWIVERDRSGPGPYLLNDMAGACGTGFSFASAMQWYRDMGYSLSGFDEIFGSKIQELFE